MKPTALDAPRDSLDVEEREFVAAIRKHGWFHTSVAADDEGPGFGYTTGFWLAFGCPEVIIFALKHEAIHDLMWDLYRQCEAGWRPSAGVVIPDLFERADAVLMPVSKAHYAEYLGWSRWFYGNDDFPCLQLVWPDVSGVFPWQAGFEDSFRADQPDLSPDGWHSHPQ